jgi:PAS domain S-box-containing protein
MTEIPLRQIGDSPEMLRAIISAAPVGLIAFDNAGIVSMWNRTAEQIFGWRADEVVGREIPFLTSENRSEFEQMQVTVRRGVTVRDREVRRQCKDGAWVDLSINNAPLYNPSGVVVGVVSIITDVTEQKRTQANVEHLASLVDTVSDAIVSVDLAFQIQSWNKGASHLYGWHQGEAVGQVSRSLLHTEYLASSYAEVDHILRAEGAWHGVLRQRHRTGGTIYVETSIAALRDPHSQAPVGYVFVNHDVTARKAAESEVLRLNTELEQRVQERTGQLQAINQELESFAYAVSHDLRAPLRGIDGFSTALMHEYGDYLDATGLHYLTRIRTSVERMSALIEGLLALSRLSRREIHAHMVDMGSQAHEILEMLAVQEPQRQVTVRIEPSLRVTADRDLLRALLENLLGNAWKFTGNQAAAVIELGKADNNDEIVYYVRDNGVGFNMDYADKLFSPFQRLHRAGEFPGFGIGLATVQRIVSRHGGRIWAQAAEGAGATFYFTLPGLDSPQ